MYIYIYIYIYRRLGGKSPPGLSNRQIGFGFVSCSCRACERAGEAKLRGRVRGVPPQRWASGWKFLRLLAGTFRVKVAAIRVGFKPFLVKSFPPVLAS